MREDLVVRHCSPTLAGLKTGNMFTCSYNNDEEVRDGLRALNRKLVKKGLRALPLRCRDNRALIYVFRPKRLCCDLQNDTACELLRERGYCCENPAKCVTRLIHRLSESEEFPHEIGLFLGYPPEDVHGFIENKAGCCKKVGCWKVYGDEQKAKEMFDKFDKCTRVYCAKWKEGRPIERLAVGA